MCISDDIVKSFINVPTKNSKHCFILLEHRVLLVTLSILSIYKFNSSALCIFKFFTNSMFIERPEYSHKQMWSF